jgi:CubicO group peptidase (beta-lactamase class C family)
MKADVRGIAPVVFLVMCCLFVLAGCSSAPSTPPGTVTGNYGSVTEYISRLTLKEMKKHDVTGLSIALVDEGGLIWAQGFGYADKKNGIPATPETVYRVASISKLFTATAVMQLAERGEIDIDAPLTRYLPEFSIKTRFSGGNRITPRNLMTHHSGLPANLYKGIFSRAPEPFARVIHEIKDEYAAYPPDSVYSYSNLGVTVLGAVVERVSGRGFASYMDESILAPVGMVSSSFSGKTDMVMAKGYRNGKEIDDPAIRDLPASGLLSNAVDMGLFMQMVLSGGKSRGRQILKPETLAEMLRPQNANVPLDLNIPVGLGWALDGLGNTDIRNAGPVAHHGGALLSFNCRLLMLTEPKIGVIILSNSSSARPVVDNVATELLILALEAKTGIKQPRRKIAPESGKPLSPEEIKVYEGHYATPVGLVKAIGNSGSLEAEVLGNRLSLVPRTDGMMGLKYKLFGFFPISLGELDYVGISRVEARGHEVLLARSQSLDMVFGEKILPSVIPGKWLNRLGAYEVANPGDDILFFDSVRIGQQEGFLVMEYSAPIVAEGILSFPLSPVSDTEAVILGLGSGMGETIRVTSVDGEESLQYSGYRLKKISAQ